MRHLPRDFKPTQVFGWENEPSDERPSDFVSTGYSTGFSTLTGSAAARRRRGNGWITLLFTAAVLGVGVLGLLMMISRLRGA